MRVTSSKSSTSTGIKRPACIDGRSASCCQRSAPVALQSFNIVKSRPSSHGSLFSAAISGREHVVQAKRRQVTSRASTGLDDSGFEAREAVQAGEGSGLLLAYSIERLGEQAWLFATPFLLMAFQSSGHALVGPAVYGISRMCAQALFAPGLGAWMDRMPRLAVMNGGTGVQVASLLSATAVCLILRQNASVGSPQPIWPFIIICLLGVADAMGKILTGVAILRDWVPTLYGRNAGMLSGINTSMARLDLFAEVLGPLGAGLVFHAMNDNIGAAIATLACTRVACLVVQLRFFAEVLKNNPGLVNRTKTDTVGGERVGLISAWRTFLKHRGGIQLVVLSYALLYLTVLSPHGLVLTAYLSTQNLSPFLLSVFRGCGALVGVLGVTAFQMLGRRVDLPQAAGAFVGLQGLCSVAAAAAFVWAGTFHKEFALYVFISLVVLARFGLYGFEVGALQLQQASIGVESRGAFGTVEKSLCATASLIMYAASAAVTGQGGHLFTAIVCASAVSICAAGIVYQQWVTTSQKNQFIRG